jgi:hypothetical protein
MKNKVKNVVDSLDGMAFQQQINEEFDAYS